MTESSRGNAVPDISIVMSEFDTPEPHLKEALDCISKQTYQNFELLLIDDCGRNDVKAIVGAYNDNRFKVLPNPRNMGLRQSLNRGIHEARGSLIARMDTDDIYSADHLEQLAGLANTHPEYAVYASRSIEVSDDEFEMILGSSGEITTKELLRGSVPSHPATLIRKSAMLSVGGYPDYSRAEDLALWCELILDNQRLYIGEQTTHRYRVLLKDYSKRTLKYRRGEIEARLHYYPQLSAPLGAYLKIIKIVVGGLLPGHLVRTLRRRVHRMRAVRE
jgi:glycosyltransferase involved in cell wall biosynthesis